MLKIFLGNLNMFLNAPKGFKFLFPWLVLILIVRMGEAVSTGDSSYFSENYAQARARFLGALEKLASPYDRMSFEVPSKAHAGLMLDAAYLQPLQTRKRLVVFSSGIHGAEAPLGSALQLYFLEKIAPRLRRENTGVLLLHSLNPYGFASGRRVTENNVDLNRNFFIDPASFANAENKAYIKYRGLISREKSVEHPLLEAARNATGFIFEAILGHTQELTQAVAGGQYDDAKAIYYGGRKYEPQVDWISSLFKKTVPAYEEFLHFDIHTGLGTAYSLQMISSIETQLKNDWVKSITRPLKAQDGIRIVSPTTKGFYQTSGDFIDFSYAQAKGRAATFTAEFGTLGDSLYDQLSTSSRIILENRGHHWGFGSKTAEETVRSEFRELFNPAKKAWRDRAMLLGERMFATIFDGDLSGAQPEAELKKATNQ